MSNKQIQKERVLNRLKTNGTLTVREAVIEMNIMSLPKRIEDLRKDGYPIETEWVYGKNAKYGVYRLKEVSI